MKQGLGGKSHQQLGSYHGCRTQGRVDGRFSNGGFPDLDLSVPVALFGPFQGFPVFFRQFSRWVPFFLFLAQPIRSTYKEHSRKGPRHNQALSRRKWETPRFTFSQRKVWEGVSCGVRPTTWERCLEKWELQTSCFEEFLGREHFGTRPC